MPSQSQPKEREELAAELRAAGFPREADRIEAVTPDEEKRFEEWLADPENARRWKNALEANRA